MSGRTSSRVRLRSARGLERPSLGVSSPRWWESVRSFRADMGSLLRLSFDGRELGSEARLRAKLLVEVGELAAGALKPQGPHGEERSREEVQEKDGAVEGQDGPVARPEGGLEGDERTEDLPEPEAQDQEEERGEEGGGGGHGYLVMTSSLK